MDEIIRWMITVEKTVAALYTEAAVVFSADQKFSSFLSLLAEEEQDHIKLLEEALLSLPEMSPRGACFSFDDEFRRKIEEPVVNAKRSLERRELSHTDMVDVVTNVEFSEWNEMFVYTLDTTKALDERFRQAISDIDQHRKHVQEYVSSLPDGEAFLEKLRKLSPVWSRRILIVEENFAVARMLEALAMDDAEVLIASNGEEGFALIEKGHFDLVVSEVELPNMNGIEMYNKAVAVDPALEGRFVFFTSTENPEHLSYLCSLNAIVLPKPSPVKLICRAIDEVLVASPFAQDKTIH